eukprot:5999088-Amphidinium_carterae.2
MPSTRLKDTQTTVFMGCRTCWAAVEPSVSRSCLLKGASDKSWQATEKAATMRQHQQAMYWGFFPATTPQIQRRASTCMLSSVQRSETILNTIKTCFRSTSKYHS